MLQWECISVWAHTICLQPDQNAQKVKNTFYYDKQEARNIFGKDTFVQAMNELLCYTRIAKK